MPYAIDPELVVGAVIRKLPDHQCELPVTDPDNIVASYIDSGLFVSLRRKLRHLTMVSIENPQSKTLLKSTARIHAEEHRHLKRHPQMIHPFSQFRFMWEILWSLTYFTLLIVMPLDIVLLSRPMSIVYVKLSLDIVSFLDVVMNFRTGYHDGYHQVVMHPTLVARHYLLGYFAADVLSALPVNFFIYLTGYTDLDYLKYLFLLKLVRFRTFLERTSILLKRYKLNHPYLTPVRLFFCLAIGILWTIGISLLSFKLSGDRSVIHRLSKSMKHSLFYVINQAVHVVRVYMLVGINAHANRMTGEVITQIVCVIIGAFINTFILAVILRVYERIMSAETSYNDLMQEMGHFVRYKGLSNRLRGRLFQFVKFKYQKRIYKEDEILRTLSRTLKDDILFHNCKHLMEKVAFFADFPTELMVLLLGKLKLEIYLTGDIVVQAGIAGNSMYFIYLGTLAVYSASGSEICHLHEGGHFGEISLVINAPRVATVVAIKECQLFKLNRKDFVEAIEFYPVLREKVERNARERLDHTMHRVESEISI